MASLAPVPSQGASCPHCSSPLAADQRYCLTCGQPVSPVRLAFLDVLQSDSQSQLAAMPVATYAGAPYGEPAAGPAWLRRYAPLFGVAAVLLLAMLIGLLVGHWVSQSGKAPGTQVIKVEGLSASAPAAAASPAAAAHAATAPSSASKASAAGAASKEEKQEVAEAKAEEKKPAAPPKPVKVSSVQLSKITNSTGRKHQEEIDKLGTAPIAVP